jgi:hypothetical protein
VIHDEKRSWTSRVSDRVKAIWKVIRDNVSLPWLSLAVVLLALAWSIYDRDQQASGRRAELRESRVLVVRILGDALCRGESSTRRKVRTLIVAGAEGSKPFEKVYRQFGFPPYEERLRLAMKQAATLPNLPCRRIIDDSVEASQKP